MKRAKIHAMNGHITYPKVLAAPVSHLPPQPTALAEIDLQDIDLTPLRIPLVS